MRKFILLFAFLITVSLGYSAAVDSLFIKLVNRFSKVAIGTATIYVDTSNAAGTFDTLTTAGTTGIAGFKLLGDETYHFRCYISGYLKDTLTYVYDGVATDTSKVTVTFPLTPWRATLSAVALGSNENDSVSYPLANIHCYITTASLADTLFSGLTSYHGTIGIPKDTLSTGTAYKCYMVDTAQVYNTNFVKFTADSTNEIISVYMDSTSSITMRTITLRTFSQSTGLPKQNVLANVTYSAPYIQNVSGAYWLGASDVAKFYSNYLGVISIKVPDSCWVTVEVSTADYKQSVYCTSDTTLGTLGVR